MLEGFITTIFLLTVLLFSVIIHELAHGWVAYSLGDPTAKYEGRLTLNPLKHLDFFGSIILPFFLYLWGSSFVVGWAKPVPVNTYNFRNKKLGELKVSIAGPLSNILLAVIFGLILRFIPENTNLLSSGFLVALVFIVNINIWLALFNLIPIPPLDGSWILFNLLPDKFEYFKNLLRQYGVIILIILIFSGGSWWSAITNAFFQLITGRTLLT